MKLSQMSAWHLTNLLKTKQISSKEIILSTLDEIDERESQIQAFITLEGREQLISKANEIDSRRVKGDAIGELEGLPIALKDNICTNDLKTTCASKMLENFHPTYDATIVEKIRNADGIIIGKTNMDEFCMGSSTENSAFKITRNPHNLECVPGGTSGGSAAAVASNETILAIGVDTGGSIRQPASYCGIVGLKPTYGRVSRYGIVAYGSSLDQAGPMTKEVKDAALLLKIISGYDPKDSTSANLSTPDYLSFLETNKKYKIGIPKEYFGIGLNEEVRVFIDNVVRILEKDGCEIIPISLPNTEYAIPAYYITACCEASSNLSRYSGMLFGYRSNNYSDLAEMITRSRSEGFGMEVKRRISLGTFALSAGYYDAYYLKAAKVRNLMKKDFQSAFQQCDVILHPVAPSPAFKIGEKDNTNPLEMYLEDVYSVTANMVGIPAISIPCGLASGNRPVGVQISGNYFKEEQILNLAFRIETLLKN